MSEDEKRVTRYTIEFLNTRANWIGWTTLNDYNNIYTMASATEIYDEAMKYIPEDIELRIVEITRVIRDYDPKEGQD